MKAVKERNIQQIEVCPRFLTIFVCCPYNFFLSFSSSNRIASREREKKEISSKEQTSNHIPGDVIQAVVSLFFLFVGSIGLSRGKITVEPQRNPSSSLDSSVSFETTYVIPSTDNDSTHNKKVRFIVQKQPEATTSNGNLVISTIKSSEMTQRKNLSFVDAVNSKHLDLSTGLFSSSSPFILSSSSTFSSSTTSPDQHRHPATHFSSVSSSPPYTTITTTDNKNLPPPVGADSTTNTATTITLKEAIDANILDAHSAYVVDTLEQR